MGYIFVQIGAGAGDLDKRADFRDGFSEIVKKIDPVLIEKIILVEPNPLNHPALQKCWGKFPQAQTFQIGITDALSKNKPMTFYYAEEDKPHYQVFSLNLDHVRKHYPRGTIRQISVETLDLHTFLNDVVGSKKIDLISLDIEGIDAEIILAVDWKKINCQYLSFEYLHLGSKTEPVLKHLAACGYIFVGRGVDYRGLDFMYENISNNFRQLKLSQTPDHQMGNNFKLDLDFNGSLANKPPRLFNRNYSINGLINFLKRAL